MVRSYNRVDSPVPPPCPSPQLQPQPLPTPPVYTRRQSLSASHSSREHLPPKLKIKPYAAASAESLVFSLKDAMVAGSPSSRRFSEHTYLPAASTSDDTLDRRRPRTADVDRSFVSLPSPTTTTSSFKRKHRRSDSITHPSDLSLPLPSSRSLARKRTRSPNGRPVPIQSEPPPPVPPLPPLPSTREGRTRSFLSKKLPPIRIPELGLGIDEKLRSPLSPLLSGLPFHRRQSAAKESEKSFLNMSPKREPKRSLANRARASINEPLAGCISVRTSHSLPDIKTAQRRRARSFSCRFFRLGTQQLVH